MACVCLLNQYQLLQIPDFAGRPSIPYLTVAPGSATG